MKAEKGFTYAFGFFAFDGIRSYHYRTPMLLKFLRNLFSQTELSSPQTPPDNKKPKLRVLLVGINHYKKIRNLNACVNDVSSIQQYLMEANYHELFNFIPERDVKMLTNEGATKAAILEAIKTHLVGLEAGDVAFFYFAGHGYRENIAVEAFKESEVWGNMSAIACHDTQVNRDKILLTPGISDKEFRYWAKKICSPDGVKDEVQFIAIFDCCHSGESTRNLANEEHMEGVRMVGSDIFSARKWADFDFGGDKKYIKKQLDANKSLAEVLPEAKHIQFAACREIELAQEVQLNEKLNGAFSMSLLKILADSGGDISYDRLYNRLSNLVPRYLYEALDNLNPQHPQMYIPPEFSELRYTNFLTQKPFAGQVSTSMIYNTHNNLWRISIGALNGVPILEDPEQESKEYSLTISSEGQKLERKGRFRAVHPGHAFMHVEDEGLDKEESSYEVKIQGLHEKSLAIFIDEQEPYLKELKAGLERLKENAAENLYSFAENREASSYSIRLTGDNYLEWINSKEYTHDNPLFKGIGISKDKGISQEVINRANQYLIQMAKWTFLKDLEYKELDDKQVQSSGHNMYPVELKIFVLDENEDHELIERQLPPKQASLSFDLKREKPEWKTLDPTERLLRFEIVNHDTDEDSHYTCSLLILSDRFGVYNLLKEEKYPLRAGDSVKFKGVRPFSVKTSDGNEVEHMYNKFYMSEDYFKDYNWLSSSHFLKLIVSRDDNYGINKFKVKSLEEPLGINKRSMRGGDYDEDEVSRGGQDIPEVKWEMHTLELEFKNPYYDPDKKPLRY